MYLGDELVDGVSSFSFVAVLFGVAGEAECFVVVALCAEFNCSVR